MSQILSQNEMSQNTLKDFFVPSFAGGFLIFLVGTIMLLIYAFSTIFGWFGNDFLSSANKLNQSIGVFSKGLTRSFDTALGGRLGQVIVWSFVGALVYILIWFVKNMINSVENDFIIDKYSHPQGYRRTVFFGVAIGELTLFVAMLVVVIVFSFIGLKIIMPASAGLTSAAVNHFRMPSSLFYVALSVLIPALAIYIWTIFVKFTTRLWQRL